MNDSVRRRALVTGASSGIGEVFARRLAAESYDLVLVARRADRLRALADELSGRHATTVETLVADLETEAGCASVERVLAEGAVDLLVNNAGFGTYGEFVRLPLDRELAEVKLNVVAVVRLTHAALGPMVGRGRGAVINVASTAAFQPIPYNATYAATKAFVLSFSEAVHEEVKGAGVTVCAVCPGPVRTEFVEQAGIDVAGVPDLAWVDAGEVVSLAIEAARAGRPVEVPGTLNKLTAAASRLAPRSVVRRIAGSIFKRVTQR